MDTDLIARIQHLEDLAEIESLSARYAWHVARGDHDQVAALFTRDGVFQSRSGTFAGQELAVFYARHLRAGQTIPLVANQIISISGDLAQGQCTMMSPWQGGGVGFCGYYEDDYRREDGAWRFARRNWSYHHASTSGSDTARGIS
jgi:hypothetical protein